MSSLISDRDQLSRAAKALIWISSDFSLEFLGDLDCPVGLDGIAILRDTLKKWTAPVRWNELRPEPLLEQLQQTVSTDEWSRFHCWIRWVYDPANSQYKDWLNYALCFSNWASCRRGGFDSVQFGNTSEYIAEKWEMYHGQRGNNPHRKEFVKRLETRARTPRSAWDKHLACLDSRGDDKSFDPLWIFEQTYDMVQFQRFVVDIILPLGPDIGSQIAHEFVSRLEIKYGVRYFRLHELPICISARRLDWTSPIVSR